MLSAIKRGCAAAPKKWDNPVTDDVPFGIDEEAVDLLKTYVNHLASKYEIASRFLLSGRQFYRLLRNSEKPKEMWIEKDILSRPAADLVGDELRDFMEGKKALAIVSGKVSLIARNE